MLKKKEIRQQILRQRKELDFDQVQELSAQICRKIKELSVYRDAENVCLYMPVNNEVDVTLLADDAWADGKTLWLPKTTVSTMGFYRFSHDTALTAGTYGILEPVSEEKLEPDQNTLVLMPGVAFSPDGGRLGYGGGYYDRYLNKWTMCKTVAVCYSFQIVDELPMEDHDVRPDKIVCENAWIKG